MHTVAVPKTKCNKSGGKESSLFKVGPEGEESRREQVPGDRCDDVKGSLLVQRLFLLLYHRWLMGCVPFCGSQVGASLC